MDAVERPRNTILSIADHIWELALMREDAKTEEEKEAIQEELWRIGDNELALKVDGFGAFKRKIEAQDSWLAGEAAVCQRSRKRLEAALENVRNLLLYVMVKLDAKVLEGRATKITKCEGRETLKIDDINLLPPEYVNEITTVARIPMKDAIERALKAKIEVPGAHLEKGEAFIQIR